MIFNVKLFHRFRVKKQDFSPEQDITFARKFLKFHIKFHYLQGKFKNLHDSQMFQVKSLLIKLPLTVGIPLNHLVIRQMLILL